MYDFLLAKKNINQLNIRMKNTYLSLCNIQIKFKHFIFHRQTMLLALMKRVITYKNQVRDAITLNSKAFTKYGWLVEELA